MIFIETAEMIIKGYKDTSGVVMLNVKVVPYN
jgi:hypothetical protein